MPSCCVAAMESNSPVEGRMVRHSTNCHIPPKSPLFSWKSSQEDIVRAATIQARVSLQKDRTLLMVSLFLGIEDAAV